MDNMMQKLYLVEYLDEANQFNQMIGIYPTLEEAKNQAEIYFNKVGDDYSHAYMQILLVTKFGRISLLDSEFNNRMNTVIDFTWMYTPGKGWNS